MQAHPGWFPFSYIFHAPTMYSTIHAIQMINQMPEKSPPPPESVVWARMPMVSPLSSPERGLIGRNPSTIEPG